MKKYVKFFGDVVSQLVPKQPDLARKLLAAAYQWVYLSNKFLLHSTASKAYQEFIGIIAKTLTNSFLHPDKSVMVNIFFPTEVIHTLNLNPMFPEGLSAYLANSNCQNIFAEIAESNDIPETFCSYHKTMMGTQLANILPKPLMICNTTLACDANQLSFRQMAQNYNCPRVVIDVPHDQNLDAVIYVRDQLKNLTPVLEDVSHKKLNLNELKQTLERSRRTLLKSNVLLKKRGSISLPTTMSGEMCSMIATHILLGKKESEEYFNRLLKVSKKSQKDHKKRLIWVHTLPNWQDSMVNIFENSNRVEIVGSDLAYDKTFNYINDDPYMIMANRLVNSHFNGNSENRIEAILDLAKQTEADGIVVFCHWGCKQTLGFSQLAKQHFEDKGYPTLVLDGDGCDSRNVADGQMVTRVNAFIEQLEGIN